MAEARSAQNIDIRRAERETHIRARYLLALEDGDAAALPGGAYTNGFLRAYAEYLGLDADLAVLAWRAEHRHVRLVRRISVPRPIRAPRGAITISPSMLRPVAFVAFVGAFAIYLGAQLLRVAQPPPLAIAEPALAVTTVAPGTASYAVRGTTSPNAIISIAAPGRDQPYRVAATATGAWSILVELRRGANLFDVDARDPATGKTATRKAQLYITVPFATSTSPSLRVDQPFAGGIFDRGSVAVQGVARNAARVAVVATPVDPTLPRTIESAVEVTSDGFFTTPLALQAGAWHLEVTAVAANGDVATVARDIVVTTPAAGR